MATRAERIVTALKGDWYGSYGLAPGPDHGPHDRSMRIEDREDGTGVVVSSYAGDDWQACRDYLKARGLLDERADHERPHRRAAPDKTELARRIWREGRPATGSPVETYLRARGIALDPPPSLRFIRECFHGPASRHLPAMVAGVQDAQGKVVAIHRTYLRTDGTGNKADVEPPKMALGPLGDGAVRLALAGPVLGLAEGIEDALSAMQLFRVPSWAALGVQRLGLVALPPQVQEVQIFADNGEAGAKGADRAADVFTSKGRRVRIRRPPPRFADWNDALRAVVAEQGVG